LVDSFGNKKGAPASRSDHYHGFSMGTRPAEHRTFNLTTVRYGINDKLWNRPGVQSDIYYYTLNKPIQSVHPGGANVVLCDGSVPLLIRRMALQIFLALANRKDGLALGNF